MVRDFIEIPKHIFGKIDIPNLLEIMQHKWYLNSNIIY